MEALNVGAMQLAENMNKPAHHMTKAEKVFFDLVVKMAFNAKTLHDLDSDLQRAVMITKESFKFAEVLDES